MASRTKPGPRSAIFHDQTPAGKRGDGGGHRAGDNIFCGICGADGLIDVGGRVDFAARRSGRSGLRRQMQSGP